jgi:hypothetical protein
MEQLTEQQLREKYGVFFTLSVDDSTGKKITVFLRKLDRVVYSSVSAIIQKDSLRGIESLLKSLWIGGDDVNLIIDDFEALRSAEVTLIEMLQPKVGTLKKN